MRNELDILLDTYCYAHLMPILCVHAPGNGLGAERGNGRMFINRTGSKRVLVRAGFTDADSFGFGACFAVTDCIDAPDFIPQGSVRLHNTMKQSPQQSHGHRDWDTGSKEAGAMHDGPEAVPGALYLG